VALKTICIKISNEHCQNKNRLSEHSSGSQTVACEGFSGGTRAAFLSYSKSFVNSFVCYANVAISLFAILILSTFEQITFF